MAVLKSAALLKKTAGLNGCWPKPGGPTDSPTSPAYVPEGEQSLLATLRLDILLVLSVRNSKKHSG
jgi:hypothetical protein